jgi:hypothetical protein
MYKKTLVAIATLMCGALALPAHAAALKCDSPVIQVAPEAAHGVAQYSITCAVADPMVVGPTVTFAGEVNAHGTPPYLVKSAYQVDMRSANDVKLGIEAREDQLATGTLVSSTVSVAALPSQFAAQSSWDPIASVLSVEERPGRWHAYTFVLDQNGGALVDSGVASTPVKNGQAKLRVAFGKEFSRLAGAGADQAIVDGVLGLDTGKLVLLVGDSRTASAKSIQSAVLQLDKRPKDIARAWALAARAKFLGLEDEVRYAEQKVAAHNPQLLEEFQIGLRRIEQFELSVQ